MQNSIISGNFGGDVETTGGDQTTNTFTSLGYNLIGTGDVTSAFNQAGDTAGISDPRLAPLGDYGGPTKTMPPKIGSPAIDTAVASVLAGDQRGVPRPVGGTRDIGAVEAVITGASLADKMLVLPANQQLSWTGPAAATFQLYFGTISGNPSSPPTIVTVDADPEPETATLHGTVNPLGSQTGIHPDKFCIRETEACKVSLFPELECSGDFIELSSHGYSCTCSGLL